MDFETYKGSLSQAAPPKGLSMAAQAPWGCLDYLPHGLTPANAD